MGKANKFDSGRLLGWSDLINAGASNAVLSLSKMIEKDVRLSCLNLKAMSPQYAANLLGGPENPVLAIYLTIRGQAKGHILLAYPPEMAYGLVDMMLDRQPSSTHELGEMERSVLEEVGNVVGTAFLNSIGDDTNTLLKPSPPVLMLDMAGAVLSVALCDILQDAEEIYATEAVFETPDKKIGGTLLIMPCAGFMEAVREHLSKRQDKRQQCQKKS